MLKILKILLAVAVTSAFIISLTVINFWLFVNGAAKLIYAFSVFLSLLIFFIGSYFFFKINELKKENEGIKHLLDEAEKKVSRIEKERNHFYEIFLNFEEGIMIMDENDHILMINPSARKILGIKFKDFKGKYIGDLCKASGLIRLLPYFTSFRKDEEAELIINGFSIHLFVSPVIFGVGSSGTIAIFRDKTHESRIEKDKTDFILSAVHQVKTLVASIKWSVKMFLSGDFGKISGDQKQILERLYKRNDDLLALVSSVVDATKIEDGIYPYNKSLIDIEDMVKSVVSVFQDKTNSKKVILSVKKSTPIIPKIMLDKEKITSVIQNLIDNALKYTGSGGNVSIYLSADEDEIRFKIKDSGIGIPADQQHKIFNKFFRANNANKLEAGGSGLGLFISKKVIEGHGGKIWFESEEGIGSIFYFTLPIR